VYISSQGKHNLKIEYSVLRSILLLIICFLAVVNAKCGNFICRFLLLSKSRNVSERYWVRVFIAVDFAVAAAEEKRDACYGSSVPSQSYVLPALPPLATETFNLVCCLLMAPRALRYPTFALCSFDPKLKRN
jgi:hypothetical protein